MSNINVSKIWPEWQIEKKIGEGSFGNVYKAVRKEHNLTSYAAIKIISIPQNPSQVDTLRSEGLNINATKTYLENIKDDFVNEIQLMESFKGIQNIVSIEDYQVVEKKDEIGWDIYIRMELLTPFNTYICDKQMTEEEVIKLGCDICTALEICGQKNIIHRDIKPNNILVNSFDSFKLGDFGVARKLVDVTGDLSQKGSPNYMAPEIVNRKPYDSRVDIYSLGIVLYQIMNENRLPFLDTEKQLLNPNERENAFHRRINGEALKAPCNASPLMANVILRACAFHPDERFSSATEMKKALMAISEGTYKVVPIKGQSTRKLDETISVRPPQSDSKKLKEQDNMNIFNKKKTKVPRIMIMLFAALFLLGGTYFVYPRLRDAFSDETSEEKKYSKGDEEKIASIIEEAEQLAEENDFEGAIAKIESGLVIYPESDDLQTKLDEYTVALKEKTLKDAEALADVGDYQSAMTLIESVQKLYGEDSEYEEAYNTYRRANVLKTASEYADKEDYRNAILTISEEMEKNPTDTEVIAAYNDYSSIYVSKVIAEADALVAEKNYKNAITKVQAGLYVLPENQELKSKLAQLEAKKPISLSNIVAFNGGWVWNNIAPIDSFGNDYSSACNYVVFSDYYENILPLDGFLSKKENGYRQVFAEYYVDEKYGSLSMQLAPYTTICQDGKAFVQLYADSELLYTSPIITRKSDALVCEVDISGAKYIKILVNIYIGGVIDGSDEGALILSDAQLWAK